MQLLVRVDPERDKRAAAEVMHEHAQRNEELEPRLPRPHAQVIVIEEPEPIALVEAADLLQHFAADEQAEASQPRNLQRLARKVTSPLGGEGIDAADIGIVDRYLLWLPAVIGDRPNHADLRPIMQAAANKSVEPAGGDDRVVVEQDDVPPPGPREALITPRRKGALRFIANDDDALRPGISIYPEGG